MTPFLFWLLILHVVLGLAGISCFVAALVVSLKNSFQKRILPLLTVSGLASFVLSWLSGGFYYATYYGQAVKPIIKASAYPWVHGVLMETKEHLFLFLPFLAAVAALLAWRSADTLARDTSLKRAWLALLILIVFFGAAITLMGAAISGAVQRPA